MEKKYRLTDETIEFSGVKLHRIEALKDLSVVKKGDKGGFVQSEKKLSHDGDCWIFGNANVFGDANVFGSAKVYGDANVFGDAYVSGNANVYGSAKVSGDTTIRGFAKVSSHSDYIVFKNWWSSGRYFTWTRSDNMWSVGCFYGTGKELIEKAYKDSEVSGREYKRVVEYVESILRDENPNEDIFTLKTYDYGAMD